MVRHCKLSPTADRPIALERARCMVRLDRSAVGGRARQDSVIQRACKRILSSRGARLAALAPCAACAVVTPAGPGDAGAGYDATFLDPDAAPAPGSFCALPGSVVSTAQGPRIVAGGNAATPDLTWLHVPVGFCAHYFATVNTARQLKFAPNGDLFAAAPTLRTTGGANNGIGGIVVLPDDDHDGVADSNIPFLRNLPAVQGLMFANGYLYYQDDAVIRRVPVGPGDRQPSASSEMVTDMTSWRQDMDHLHWPKVFDIARDGTIYVSNGASQLDSCNSSDAVRGAIVKLNADGSTSDVAKGFRNPIAIRCEANQDVCLVAELALDYSFSSGREKLVPVRQGDDWGYPCCATYATPYPGVTNAATGSVPDCSRVAPENASFLIGHTPFGLDFETGRWPAPWTGRVLVTLHGAYQTWEGARVVAIALDPNTGLPQPSSELRAAGTDPANLLEFATGWDDGRQDHGRPAPVAFAPDGRLFLGDDQRGAVIWIAPVELMQK
jgi:glucose/arabinose dehydrogenase